MSKSLLKITVGLVAALLAGCAAFFSIVGLAKLFAGAAVAVIIMAGTLEASKIVLASYLYRYWDTLKFTLKSYLLVAVVVIASITSIGIYGFLSSAYQDTKSKYDLSKTATDSLSVKKAYYDATVVTLQNQLAQKNLQLDNLNSIRNSQEQRANNLVTANRNTNAADRSARRTDEDIKTTSKEISSINEKILLYSDSASKMNSEITKVSLTADIASELGSLQYISKVFNVSMDLVVNILIILFIIVFDPLAIAMVIAFNSMNLSKENSNNSIIDLPKEEIPLSSVKFNVETIDSTQEQPSEHPQISSETQNEPQILEEPVQTVQMEKEREDIYDEIQEKLKQKQERLRQSYTGAVSVDTSKTY
jgi:hypothetical protein